MSYVGLHRSDQASITFITPVCEHQAKRTGFDRVTDRGSCSVRFHVANALRLKPCLIIRNTKHFRLRFDARHSHRGSISILINHRSADRAINTVAIFLRLRKRLDDKHSSALTTNISVGTVIKGKALASRGKHRRFRETNRCIRRQKCIHTSGQSHRRLSGPHALTREVDRDKSRRTGRIDRDSGPLQIKQIGDTVRGN